MTELDRLFEAAETAGPGNLIELRDPIAAHGAAGIPRLRDWLSNERLSAFAVRTLERIAREPGFRQSAVEALKSVDPATVSESVARDFSDALARLGSVAPRHGDRARGPAAAVESWPRMRQGSALELRFHDDMLDIFRLAGEATRRQRPDGTFARGYWASYFLRGVRNHGGPDYARQLLRKTGTSDGFERLKEEGRLDLSVEALVLRPEYSLLFNDDERRIAAHRLAEAGHIPPRPS